MCAATPFTELIHRIRAGDQQAAAELVRQFEPEVRRYVRVRLTDPALHRVLDSLDICQSVLGAFFVRLALGEFDLDEPGQLVRLLVRMARNKLVDHARRLGTRRVEDGDSGLWSQLRGKDRPPEEIVATADLLNEVRGRLSAEESQLVELRAEGRSWAEIAAREDSTPDAVRKRVERALTRVCRELGLE